MFVELNHKWDSLVMMILGKQVVKKCQTWGVSHCAWSIEYNRESYLLIGYLIRQTVVYFILLTHYILLTKDIGK